MIELSEREFSEIHNYIRIHYGVDLGKKKYLIESKLWIELAYSKSDTYAEYWRKLKADKSGVMEQRMMDLLTTNYTFFCREEKHLEFICRDIIPKLPANRTAPLKIWSAGCSTGQECYTIAMVAWSHILQLQNITGELITANTILGASIKSQNGSSAMDNQFQTMSNQHLLCEKSHKTIAVYVRPEKICVFSKKVLI